MRHESSHSTQLEASVFAHESELHRQSVGANPFRLALVLHPVQSVARLDDWHAPHVRSQSGHDRASGSGYASESQAHVDGEPAVRVAFGCHAVHRLAADPMQLNHVGSHAEQFPASRFGQNSSSHSHVFTVPEVSDALGIQAVQVVLRAFYQVRQVLSQLAQFAASVFGQKYQEQIQVPGFNVSISAFAFHESHWLAPPPDQVAHRLSQAVQLSTPPFE